MEMEISTDKMNEKGSLPEGTNPSAAEAAMEPSEMPLIMETTVEVCVKMVVSRKYVTNTIDPKTGRVISSSVKTDEDPPTVLNVHTYKTSVHPPQSSEDPAGIQLSAPHVLVTTPAPKRRPGRPRKYPVLTPSSTAGPVKHNDSVKEVAANVSSETKAGEVEHTSADSGMDPAVGQPEGAGKAKTKTEHKSTVSTGQQALEDRSPSKERLKKHPPTKRRVGRPSRVIKKPRKYLEDYDLEFFKSEHDAQDEENSEEDEEEEEAETVVESEDKEEEQGEEEEEEGKQREGKGGGGKEEGKEGEEGGKEKNGETTEEAEGGEHRMECPKCGKKFSNPSNCQRHISKKLCSRQYQCRLCNELFDTRDLLDAHVDNESHQDQINYRCSDCQRMYATRNGYLKHKRQGTCYKRDIFHEDGRQGEFECSQCRVRFTNDKLLELHKEKVHENPNNEFRCPDCNRVFYTKLGFNKHVARKACTQPHECKVCGKKYSNKAKESFKSHMRYHLAETSGVQFQCEDCGRVYMTDMALKKHRLTSHSGLRPYKCGTCSKAFPMRYMVRDHERSHTGEKPFLCNLCGSSFGNRGHLYRHMRSHTLGTLHKRGRPRKYPHHPSLAPRTQQVILKLSREGEEGVVRGEDGQVYEEMVVGGEGEGGGTLGVMEIKTDLQQDDGREVVGQGAGEEMGSTYITVHTIDGGQLGDSGTAVAQSLIGDGQLQHVVMETPDGMSDNMVLQVIRNLTGATTVYQHIMEPQQPVSGAAPSSSSEAVAPLPALALAPQSLVSAAAAAAAQQESSHQLVAESGSVESVGQSVVVGGRRGQFVVSHSSQAASVTQQQNAL